MYKLLVALTLTCVVFADSSDKQEITIPKSKSQQSPQLNQLLPQQQPKYETIYQPIKYQPVQPKYVPIQIIPKPYYISAAPPQPGAGPHAAMIIIAQPALLPQSVVYGNNPTQQLLNYFHNNPQAKYQLLHGAANYQQQQQPTYMQQVQQVVASPSIGNYILAQQYPSAPAPVQYQQQQQQPATQQIQYQPAPQHVQTIQNVAPAPPSQPQYQQTTSSAPHYASLSQIAQLAAQHYHTQTKSAPAIVTGFENFTPDQQAQIKQQLNAHLGSNYHALSAVDAPTTQLQYSSRYNAEPDEGGEEFVPSPQMKNEESGATSASASNVMKARARYNKG